ncbi:hypothetical protein FGLOB1_2605 [Fusarium globosum]|uniref:Uncharacterized protein n=1 Tax=Fusarium globosum TaxID=78864 RepID=A0A8H6DH23_9HYPO|nr:hypothetical protein FGLOB1_2605 [Fusarium globosum]
MRHEKQSLGHGPQSKQAIWDKIIPTKLWNLDLVLAQLLLTLRQRDPDPTETPSFSGQDTSSRESDPEFRREDNALRVSVVISTLHWSVEIEILCSVRRSSCGKSPDRVKAAITMAPEHSSCLVPAAPLLRMNIIRSSDKSPKLWTCGAIVLHAMANKTEWLAVSRPGDGEM